MHRVDRILLATDLSEESERPYSAMAELADTDGLIIDVRENGGGSRDALRALLPYFLTEDEPARVVNVGAYRLLRGQRADTPDGYLANRHLYPAAWRGWSDAARRAHAEMR